VHLLFLNCCLSRQAGPITEIPNTDVVIPFDVTPPPVLIEDVTPPPVTEKPKVEVATQNNTTPASGR
jgi:hypothetical protein